MVRNTETAFVPNLRGGDGTIEIRHILNKDELMGHASMYAHVIIPAHASIGFHQHVENTEPYYVLKGKGIFEDNDHTETEIHRAMSVSSRLARATRSKILLMSRLRSWHL